jgi:ABC-type microcin C transport system duplicated ATPase subunit YejF
MSVPTNTGKPFSTSPIWSVGLRARQRRRADHRRLDLAASLRGETLCVVGESGSGKSVTSLATA